ncbi:hypothetical protein [uncultured Murdochiella sp.]|uniref:hypothetical protein n=1 Tax=uncultured Murdochiella sp. TaxID=1586095 RepID=UPI0028038DE5|nr:hypothetical protein [uncultured Murdochiella sp.]
MLPSSAGDSKNAGAGTDANGTENPPEESTPSGSAHSSDAGNPNGATSSKDNAARNGQSAESKTGDVVNLLVRIVLLCTAGFLFFLLKRRKKEAK